MTGHDRVGDGQPSASLRRRIRRHRQAFLVHDRLVPLADPVDRRFDARRVQETRRWQDCENRRRLELLAARVRKGVDLRIKAAYLLGYPGSDFLISGPEEVGIFLRSLMGERA